MFYWTVSLLLQTEESNGTSAVVTRGVCVPGVNKDVSFTECVRQPV